MVLDEGMDPHQGEGVTEPRPLLPDDLLLLLPSTSSTLQLALSSLTPVHLDGIHYPRLLGPQPLALLPALKTHS